MSVPPIPDLRTLPRTCTDFLEPGEADRDSGEFRILIGATGGSAAATSAWCRTYLALWREGQAAAN